KPIKAPLTFAAASFDPGMQTTLRFAPAYLHSFFGVIGSSAFFFFDKRKKNAAPVGTRATAPKTATKSTKSPNADMPPEAWAPDSGVRAAWRATAAEAMRNAKR